MLRASDLWHFQQASTAGGAGMIYPEIQSPLNELGTPIITNLDSQSQQQVPMLQEGPSCLSEVSHQRTSWTLQTTRENPSIGQCWHSLPPTQKPRGPAYLCHYPSKFSLLTSIRCALSTSVNQPCTELNSARLESEFLLVGSSYFFMLKHCTTNHLCYC